MDEGMLNDLLECSVCLERLDTSSKVLPCQHTFCKRCLEGIVDRHKELRCPECRTLVPCKIEELPPNVLLMRILEGMRNALPKKEQQRLIRVVHPATPIHQLPEQHRRAADKQVLQHHVPQTHQPYAKAMYDYSSKVPEDLNFKRGDIIMLRKRIDNNWYHGECGGNQGVFPLSYVQVITPLPSNIPQCKALYEFRMTNDDEEGCLTFNKGDIITVIRRVDENWAEGKLDDRIGIFPLAFVELNSLARSLMKLSTNTQPGPSRLAPPTPTSDDSTPLIPTDHTRTISNVHVAQHAPAVHHQTAQSVQPSLPASDSSSTVSSGNSSSTTPNTSSGSASSSSSTAPSSPASPPNRNQAPPRSTVKPDLLPTQTTVPTPSRVLNSATTSFSTAQQSETHSSHHNREKRHSFTSLTIPQHQPNNHRHSAEILSSEVEAQPQPVSTQSDHPRRSSGNEANLNTLQLPAAYVALYPYKPQKADELELRKGGIYIVTERCQDGWFKGTSNRTQKCGVFPGNYVTLARGAPRSPQPSPRSGENTSSSKSVVSYTRSGKSRQSANSLPPDLPPRSSSPAIATNTISSSWHGQQDNAAMPLGRSSSAIMSSVALPTNGPTVGKPLDELKERKEKGTVSLMRRLTSIKRSKLTPATSYMDNPVFEDSTVPTPPSHPVHVRSGSCPSQLLQVLPAEHHRMFVSTSQRLKHKDRPSVFAHSSRTGENIAGSSASSPDVHLHRKSNSLDAGNRSKTGTQTVRERFRCIAPYPPNSEYELELQVNDIIYVHKKRDDGWYKGTQQRTGRTGLFPASFVESF
ncbi:hypothetical protein PPYR_07730 [Photinus pyralis]|uniref:RING-type E3 ubiquitin transferase n=1 Tax=Photinus pyralis TaxID=7054 RepID=A0A5N4AR95_PHOPY|nr:E3 ubiquitin-protein ligase SH3RF1-like isoform X1 [Photinus pyralis]KAB0799850.1 hypothetical protein PPYR_07730 [Photinus pyralis]